MAAQLTQVLRQLQFSWMGLVGPTCGCDIVHPSKSCLAQILLKFTDTLKTISKFYIIFHVIAFVLKLKKMIREQRLVKSSMKSFLNFLGSLCFMLHLVCGLKITLCVYSQNGWTLQGKTFFWGGIPTGLSILWQSSSRRQQIAYYAFVRSLRGIYMYLKRRDIIKFQIQNKNLIPLFFGVLFYVFTQNHHNLKYLNIFQGLWGNV